MFNFDRFDEKLDRIYDKIERIVIIQARQEENLKEHMKRTAIAEKNIEIIHKELSPIKNHVERVKGAFWIITSIGAIVGFVGVIYGILGFYK